MNDQPNLVTSCTFKEKQHIVKMNLIRKNLLELSIIDKYSAEEWRGSYDSTYIENLTHKTGNYKQFDIFVTMLKSGLLRTSECITLDLLTLEDLELLRTSRIIGNGSRPVSSQSAQTVYSGRSSSNRRYLILTYTVEFDRIHYPLPMEYVGPPNPQVLLATIRRLEAEIDKLKYKLNNEGERIDIEIWRDRVRELEAENYILTEEVAYLRELLVRNKGCSNGKSSDNIPVALKSLEEQVRRERASFKATLKGLQEQNHRLRHEVEDLRGTEASYVKPEFSVPWKDRGQSPTVCNHHITSPRQGSGLQSPDILSMNPLNKKWKDRLCKDNCGGMASKISPQHGHRIPHTKHFKRNREHSSSGSSCHSRPRSFTDTQAHWVRDNFDNKSRKGFHDTQNHRRTSSSSCGSEGCCKGQNKDDSIKNRSSSRSSSFSDASLSSGSRALIRSRKQNISNKLSGKPSTILQKGNNRADKDCIQKPKHKFTLRKCSRNFLNKETRAGISELETRIKALQKLLEEGISIP